MQYLDLNFLTQHLLSGRVLTMRRMAVPTTCWGTLDSFMQWDRSSGSRRVDYPSGDYHVEVLGSWPGHCINGQLNYHLDVGTIALFQAGNVLATRMVALLMLCICRQIRFFVEQPDRSAACIFPYLMHLLSFPQVEPQRVFWSGSHLLSQVIFEVGLL